MIEQKWEIKWTMAMMDIIRRGSMNERSKHRKKNGHGRASVKRDQMLEQRQITLTVDADTIRHLRHAATMLRALGEILPIALAQARMHLRHEARELEQLARAIEREVEGD